MRAGRQWGAVAILAGAAMVLAACDGGTVTQAATSAAPSRDDAGHQVLFRLRPGARSFQHVYS